MPWTSTSGGQLPASSYQISTPSAVVSIAIGRTVARAACDTASRR